MSEHSLLQSPEKPKKFDRVGAPGGGGLGLSDLLTSIVAKHQKIDGGHFGEVFISKNRTQNAEKTGNSLVKNFFRKKSLTLPKKLKEGTL